MPQFPRCFIYEDDILHSLFVFIAFHHFSSDVFNLVEFSLKDLALVAPEAPSEQARRVFQTYDPEGKICSMILCMLTCNQMQMSSLLNVKVSN